MHEIARFADGFGPAKILHVHEPRAGLLATLVVDNVAAGPSIGGIRMAPDVTLEECFRLARAMTMKNIAAGLPHGGGKVVVTGDPKMERGQKEPLIRALACSLRDIREYILAPDMGTNEECMAWIKDEVDRVVGIPAEMGGIPLDEIGATGWGLFHAIEIASGHCGFDLKGARFVVQGFGAVGSHTARFLADRGAVLVGVADSGGAIINSRGIEVRELIDLKRQNQSVTACRRAETIAPERLLTVECEIWIPAARPDIINETNVGSMHTRMVAQGANIPCTPGAELYLHDHQVLCLPDYIVNAGGVICAASEYQRMGQQQAMARIEQTLRHNTAHILTRAREERCPPRAAADQFAHERLARVMACRRWSIF